MDYVYIDKKEYDQIFEWNNKKIRCFSKKKFQEMYPEHCGGFRIVGSIGKGDMKKIGLWSIDKDISPYYDIRYNSYLYDIEGYILVGNDEYLMIVRHVLLKRCIQLLVSILLIIILLYIGYNLFQSSSPDIDPLSSKYENAVKANKNTDPNKITIPGYGDIKMKANTDTAYVALYNPDNNPCYFKFAVIEDDTGEKIYESKLVPPSNAITEVKFNKKIAEGIHPVTIQITSYDLSDSDLKKNGGEVKTQIIGIKED